MKTQFTVDKEFIKEAYNSACPDWKDKLKNKFPEAFGSELETGKWYKSNLFEEKLYCFTKFEQCDGYVRRYYYGFSEGVWRLDYTASNELDKSWTPATDKEVETALIEEAKRKYNGKTLNPLNKNLLIGYDYSGVKLNYNKSTFDSRKRLWVASCCGNYNIIVFDNGKWAEIISEPIELTLEQRIEIIEEQLKIMK